MVAMFWLGGTLSLDYRVVVEHNKQRYHILFCRRDADQEMDRVWELIWGHTSQNAYLIVRDWR